MRKSLLVGVVLAVVAFLVIVLSDLLDLELESVVLIGVAVGAALALVPDRTPLMRLAGFAAGLVLAFIGYFVRAAVMPDTNTGRAVAVAIVLLLCTAAVGASMGRLALWATLLGAGTFAGAYEFTFAAAQPEVATTSVTALTSLLVTVACGYFTVALLAPGGESARPAAPRQQADGDGQHHPFDEMMETSK